MKKLLKTVFIWFLIIQSFGLDAKVVTIVPMQDRSYCEAAITQLPPSGFYRSNYFCVDAGDVSPL